MSGIVNSTGAVSGVLGTTVGTPAGIGEVLYTVINPGAAVVSINGYFDDNIYAYYKLMVTNMHNSTDAGGAILRVLTGGSIDGNSYFWNTCYGSFSDAGTLGAQTRADNDGANYSYLSATWSFADSAAFQGNNEIIFAQPQNGAINKLFRWRWWADSHGSSETYVIDNTGLTQWRATTALTGISYQSSSGSLTTGRITLYGYRF